MERVEFVSVLEFEVGVEECERRQDGRGVCVECRGCDE